MKDGTKIDPVKDFTLEEKVRAVRMRFAHAAEDSIEMIDRWEKDITTLEVNREWLAHPVTQSLKKLLIDHQRRILSVLATDRALPNEVREGYFQTMESALIPLLTVLQVDVDEQLKIIEESIDRNLV